MNDTTLQNTRGPVTATVRTGRGLRPGPRPHRHCALVALVSTLGAASPALATSYFVDAAGAAGSGCTFIAPCSTIAEAVSLTAAGDEVWVYPGTYNESGLVVPHELQIGGSGVGVTIVDAGTSDRHLSIDTGGADVTLRDLTLQNGQTTGSGGAIKVISGSVTVLDSELASNIASFDGGAVSCAGACAGVTIRRTTLQGNLAGRFGGAIYTGADALVRKCDLIENEADIGGAIYANQADLTVLGSQLSDNIAELEGGAIRSHFNQTTVLRSSFVHNSVTSGAGGGIYLQGDATSSLTMDNLTFSENSAALAGGIYVFGLVNSTLNHATMVDNSGTLGGSDISFGGTFDLSNSLLTHPNLGAGNECLVAATTGVNNLVDTGSCGAGAAFWLGAHDNAFLGALGNHGGRTLSYSILQGSLALSAGGGICPVEDQRGAPRPSPAGAACDIGSFENQLF